jgi:hypothetical protein
MYTVVANNTTTNCVSNMTGNATITINPLPAAYTVTGTGSYCAGGSGLAIGLANSDAGINYQLYLGGTPVGSQVAGTGHSISFGLQTASGTYTVVANNVTTSCVSNMTGSATITINPLPAAIAGTNSAICLSGSTQIGASPVDGDTYSWSSSPSGFTSNVANPTVSPTVTTTYTMVETIMATGCTNTHTVTVTVNPLPGAIAGTNRAIW